MKKKIPLLRLNYSKREKKFILLGIKEILNSGYLTMAKKVSQFEELFAKFVGTKYAVAVNSGTSALEIPLRSLDVKNKSIIVPTNTEATSSVPSLKADPINWPLESCSLFVFLSNAFFALLPILS